MNHSIGSWIFLIACLISTGSLFAQGGVSFDKSFSPATIGPGSVSTLIFTITNSTGDPIENMAFTDVLPAGVIIADPANGAIDCAGVLDAPDGGGTISLTNGTLGDGETCTMSVDVTSSTTGTHMNMSGTLTYNEESSAGTASADLTVDAGRPGFSKSFSPSSIDLGETSTLTFTIDNSTNSSAVSSLDFEDILPAGLVIADPPNASSDCETAPLESMLTANPGTDLIDFFYNGIISFPGVAAGATCTINVDVISTGTGQLENVSGDLNVLVGTSDLNSGHASATLEVTRSEIHIQKEFIDDPLAPGGMGNLEFTITNFNRNFSAIDIAFTDNLDAALSGLAATGLPQSVCGGTLSTTDGGMTINLTGASLGPGLSCTFSVPIQVPISATHGTYTNTSSAVTGMVDGSPVTGNDAAADLFVAAVPIFTKTFLGDAAPGGTVELEFSITNSSATHALNDISFTDEFDVIFQTASVLPMDGDCGVGSDFTFTPLSDPAMGTLIPARLSLSGGSLDPGASCIFSITLDVLEGAPGGVSTNTTSALTGTVDGNMVSAPPATDDVTILYAPQLIKEFLNDPVMPGSTVDVQFTISLDEQAPADVTDIAFTDDLNAALTGLAAVGLPMNNVCGAGSLISGTTLLSFTGGSLSPGTTCSFTVTLQVPANAMSKSYTNTSSNISAMSEGSSVSGNQAQDDLVVTSLILNKEFTNDPVGPGDNVTLEFTLTNSSDDALENIQFTDDLDDALIGLIAVGLPLNDICGTGSSLVQSGSGFLTFSGGSLAATSSCTFSVELTVPAGAAEDGYVNTTSSVSAKKVIGGATVIGPPASDELIVMDQSSQLTLTKSFLDNPVTPGATTTLQFNMSFLGGSDATAIAFTDDLDGVISGMVATSVLSNTCSAIPTVGATIGYSGGTLSPGDACSFSIEVMVPGDATPGPYTNTTSMITAGPIMGNSASDILTIIDQVHSLVPDAGPDQSVECMGANGAEVMFDGSGSSSANPPILSYTWTENGQTIATGANPTVTLSLGQHIITLIVTDAILMASDQVVMNVLNMQDSDNDGTPDCTDDCPNDPDNDADGDGVCGDLDGCPNDPNKTAPGACGCGTADVDSDGDGVLDCDDNCPDDANADQLDADCDGVGDVCDLCPGGDDSVDNNNDGLPDCAFPPDFEDIVAAWKCGS
ncbi:MAG: hypothetical protein OEQ53_15645, partial [Saprospiraceae bacterium]|nr:hypothetical protein [Saprospiraceae bacterium]